MKRNVLIAAGLLVAFGCNGAWSADSSPQPTTSPTNTGKTGLKPVNATELSRFVNARSAVSASIADFNALVSKGKSGASSKDLQNITNEINRQANAILQYAKSSNNTVAEKLASQLILDDDVGGRQSTRQATARRLLELDAQLGLLEPVVHR